MIQISVLYEISGQVILRSKADFFSGLNIMQT